jgi:nicotinamidase-related amidase
MSANDRTNGGPYGRLAAKSLLTPDEAALILIDHQGAMTFCIESHDRTVLVNNVTALAKSAREFEVPTILTTIASESVCGPIFPEIRAVFPDVEIVDRTSTNSFEDENVIAAVEATGRKKLVMAGLWTEICLLYPALSALEAGYQVYFVVDASGGVSKEAHGAAVTRMVQAGAIPVTWMTVHFEFHRDWARTEYYEPTLEIIRAHGGAYGQFINYYGALVAPGAGVAAG